MEETISTIVADHDLGKLNCLFWVDWPQEQVCIVWNINTTLEKERCELQSKGSFI